MARQDRDSQYGSGSYNSSSNRSGRTTTTTGSGGGGGYTPSRETYRTSNSYKTKIDPAVKRKNELALKVAKEKKDAQAFKDYSYQPPTGLAKFSPISQVMSITSLGKKSFEVNKSYYEKNLIGKTNLATGKAYSASVEDYKSYMSARGSGSIDAMGREVNNRDGGGGQLVEKNIGGRTLLTTTPTTAEVSQSNAAQVEDSEELRKKRVKAKGRSPTIMTGVTGVTGGLTLGKPSLLGRA